MNRTNTGTLRCRLAIAFAVGCLAWMGCVSGAVLAQSMPGVAALSAASGLLQGVAAEEGHASAPLSASAPPGAPRVLRDLAYGPHPLQRMDVYLPPGAARAPVLFLVHGGGWRGGDKANPGWLHNKLAHWLPQGVVVVSVNYRLLPEARPDAQADDVAHALAWAQQQAAQWGADPARFVLMGHSAGAHLVALLAGHLPALQAIGVQPVQAAVVLDTAVLDVPTRMAAPRPRLYDQAFGSDPGYWKKVSPLEQLRPGTPPLLVVCSSLRPQVCEHAQQYAGQVQALGGYAQWLPQALRHIQTSEQLGLPGHYTDAVDQFLARSAGWQRP